MRKQYQKKSEDLSWLFKASSFLVVDLGGMKKKQYLWHMNLSKESVQKILQQLSIEKLNQMQEEAFEASKTKKDLILLSPTGSGKTLAFLLGVLQQLIPNKQKTQALIIVPSRELAMQIERTFKQMKSGFSSSVSYGGHSMKIEKNNLKNNPNVLVGTPGRIADHLRRQTVDLRSTHTLVFDEFDKSLELGFLNEIEAIVAGLPQKRYTILTSATDSLQIPEFLNLKNEKTLDFSSTAQPEKLKLYSVRANDKDKLSALFQLVCTLNNEPSLVFCNHRDATERISGLLKDAGLSHGVFHGGMEQEDRERELIKFRNQSHQLLITTDLASRGLDIPQIKHIIHYQLPTKETAFVHRNGRTARMFADGNAYLVLAQAENIPRWITENVEPIRLSEDTHLPEQSDWQTIFIDIGRKDKVNKIDIVGLFLQKGGLEKSELGLIEVLDNKIFVAVKKEKATKLITLLKGEKLKKKSVRIRISN